MTAILASPHLAGLEVLDLSGNAPGAAWVGAVAAGPRRLRELWVENDQLDGAAAEALAGSPFLGGLRRLSLRGNPVGDAGAAALARSPYLAGLRELGLGGCGIGDAGAFALADPAALPRLEGFGGLRLSHNGYGPEAARLLRTRLGYDPSPY